MIQKQTILDQIEITRNGTIQFRIGLLLVEDGQEITEPKWHRSAIEPGGDVDAQVAAVNANLKQMGQAELPADDLAKLKAHSEVAWTPDVVAAHKASVAAALVALDEKANAQAEHS
jgi:hypothetical protein